MGNTLTKDDLHSLKSNPNVKWVKIGTEYGGWYVPDGLLNRGSTCYCLGAGEDVSFDLGLINRYNCSVISVDPTPRAIKHRETIIENQKKRVSTPILSGNVSEVYYKLNENILDKWVFLPYGVWIENKTQKFFAPKNPEHVSHSIMNLQGTDEYFEAECRTIKSIMEELGHKKIDVLKMDIEGVEQDVVRFLFENSIFPKLLLLDFDQPCTMEKMVETTELIIKNGYDFCRLDGSDATFLRK